MTEPVENDDVEGLNEEQALRIFHALLKRWFELTLEEIEKDKAKLEKLDPFERIVVRARWHKTVDLILATGRAMKKYKTPRGELDLVSQIFGAQLGFPTSQLPADIETRLDWYKARIS